MADFASFREIADEAARKAGFDLCGVSAVMPADRTELRHFPEWIEAGKAGEMAYLKARNEAGELKRSALEHVAPWAKSVIVCGLNYNAEEVRSIDAHDPRAGWISRYAWFAPAENGKGTDYHDAVLRRLRAVEAEVQTFAESLNEGAQNKPLRTWCYVDTGPLVERVYAKYAGLGWMAKNTCIINEKTGSLFFLGVILTSFEFPRDEGSPALATDRCGSCTRCIEACPTQALSPYQLDATRCISYLTIEKRGEVTEELREKMGRHVFGCDICQDVCPWNGAENPLRRAPVTQAAEFRAREELVNPALDWLAGMSREEFNRVFKDSPVKRAKYSGVRRNAAIAMGNSGDPGFRPRLQALAADSDPVVARHAEWGLRRLESQSQLMSRVPKTKP